jgi:hypothetical protein
MGRPLPPAAVRRTLDRRRGTANSVRVRADHDGDGPRRQRRAALVHAGHPSVGLSSATCTLPNSYRRVARPVERPRTSAVSGSRDRFAGVEKPLGVEHPLDLLLESALSEADGTP